jgi:hypothetical protein
MATKMEKIEELVLRLHRLRAEVRSAEAELKSLVNGGPKTKARAGKLDLPAGIVHSVETVAPGEKDARAADQMILGYVKLSSGKVNLEELATKIYGDGSMKMRNRVSARMHWLKMRQHTLRFEGGLWRVVDPPPP